MFLLRTHGLFDDKLSYYRTRMIKVSIENSCEVLIGFDFLLLNIASTTDFQMFVYSERVSTVDEGTGGSMS